MSQQEPPREQTKEELLKRMESAYAELEDTLRPLSEAQLTRIGKDGWAIKDHLSHLAIWELSVVGLLERRPRFDSPRLEEAERQGKSEDETNEIVFQEHAALTAAQAAELYRDAHRQMLRVINSISNDDLYKPYASFLPEGEEGPSTPVLGWIIGNTYGHYNEHIQWIRELI